MVRAGALCDDETTMSTEASPTAGPRKAYRSSDERLLGGVAAGLAQHLGVERVYVRVAFLVMAAVGGFGVALYAGLWLILPTDSHLEQASPGLEAASRQGKRPGRARRRLHDVGPLVAIGAIALGIAVFVQSVFGAPVLFWPVLLGVVGLAVLWRQADEAQRERWMDSSGRISFRRAVVGSGGVAAYGRLAAGVGLLLSALVLFAVQTNQSGQTGVVRDVVVAGVLGVAGLALMVGPWLFRLTGDLSEERAARVRSQERADMAAHLHDSVLQTLALIQKNSGDAIMVARLARSQERDLRAWLFESVGTDVTLAGELRAHAAIVEDTYPVVVDVVAVGDLDMTESLKPITDATREALTNAAKHAGVPRIDVYAEVSPEALDVFVRDRGAGFDPTTVADDRQGVRGSIIDRMARHGGRAEVRSAPGDGTEVRLHLPLKSEEKS